MRINLTDIEDAITYQNEERLNVLFGQAEQTINNGEPVLIERRYSNARPDTEQVFTTLAQLSAFRAQVNETSANLEKRKQELFNSLRTTFPNGV